MDKLSLYLNDRGSDNVIITLNKYAQAIRRMPNYAQYMSDSMKDEFNRYGLVKTYDSTLKINDENAIGATIKLQLIVDNKIVAEKEISIIVGF